MMGDEGGSSSREGGGGNMDVVREARAGVAWMLTGAEEVFRWRRLANLRGMVDAGIMELEGMLSSSSKAVAEVVVVARTSLKRLLAGVALTWMEEGRRDCFLSSGRGVSWGGKGKGGRERTALGLGGGGEGSLVGGVGQFFDGEGTVWLLKRRDGVFEFGFDLSLFSCLGVVDGFHGCACAEERGAALCWFSLRYHGQQRLAGLPLQAWNGGHAC